MRFLSTKTHGVIDYLTSFLLIASPWLLGFANDARSIATIIPVTMGVLAIIYSLLTNYELGAVKLISMRGHLWLDALSGLFLAASPWLFNFDNQIYMPHLLLGIFEIMASLITKPVAAQNTMAANRI